MNSIKPKVVFIALSCALLFLSNPSLSQPVNQTYTTEGGYTYTIPSGWTATIKVEIWGGGGAVRLAGGAGRLGLSYHRLSWRLSLLPGYRVPAWLKL